ncbi:mannitol dehydrogenase family protein [Arthrobacter wenxiniae]|uniref:Mannitol-1-phosphate 5-dehydrogenase n=1 Tax=Arthrobacter wenxiniae TaxID=2713570 RepID=A0A7Y7LYI1_9MICC|nr:mannitol dehydrogenase family protein [Arthrobacter wenxiniae]
MQKLIPASLDHLPANVAGPTYERSALTVGIVHFGVGGFHRAHQAMYLDRLMAEGKAYDWAICGVGVLPADAEMKRVMDEQSCLYTLILKHSDGRREPRVIGSIVEYLFAPDSPEAVIEKMASEQVRIVSLTVTEGGYNFNQVTGEFDKSTAEIVQDLQAGAVPKTVFGLVTEALARRRARGLKPFTVMSCDNIQGNGDVARKMFTTFAKLKDLDLGRWMEGAVHFPNSMVDRITPATTAEDRNMVAEDFGIEDLWPVVCEPFTQWVLEDDFPLGRPEYEDAGVQVVHDVEPFELMKLRLLNASHQGFCYFGMLAGYTYAHELFNQPEFAQFLLAYMNKEATPTLKPVPGVDLDDYKNTLIERFSNEYIRDTLTRIGTDGSDRIPKFLLPVVHENLEAGREIGLSAAIVASWAKYCEGVDENGNPLTITDRAKDERITSARRQAEDPLAFIRNEELFGLLAEDQRFVEAYLTAAQSLREHGAVATIASLAQN